MVVALHRLDDSGMFAQDRARTRFVSAPAREMETLERRCELQHCSERILLLELRRDVQGREAVADRPEVDVIAARRLFAVIALSGPQVDQIGVGLKHRARLVAESERRRENDVRRCPSSPELTRPTKSARPPAPD